VLLEGLGQLKNPIMIQTHDLLISSIVLQPAMLPCALQLYTVFMVTQAKYPLAQIILINLMTIAGIA
jgi:hypothetical protein